MVTIPGTSYQITGSQIQTSEGQPVSQEEFLQKVKGGEVSLTANSLQMIESHLGPDLGASLTAASQAPGAADRLLTKLGGEKDEQSFDITKLLLLMAKSAETMRTSQAKIRDSQFQQQINELDKQAKDTLSAGMWKMVAGCIAGGLSLAGSALSAKSGFASAAATAEAKAAGLSNKMAMSLGETAMKKWGAAGDGMGASGKLGDAFASYFGSAKAEQDASADSTRAKQAEADVAKTRDMLDSVRELDQKVREALQAINSADAEAGKTVARM